MPAAQLFHLSNIKLCSENSHQLFWLSFAQLSWFSVSQARRFGAWAGVQIPDFGFRSRAQKESSERKPGERLSLATRSVGEPTRTNFTLSLNLIFFASSAIAGHNVAGNIVAEGNFRVRKFLVQRKGELRKSLNKRFNSKFTNLINKKIFKLSASFKFYKLFDTVL